MADKTLEIIMKVRDLATQPIKAIGMATRELRDSLNATHSGQRGIGDTLKSVGEIGKIAKAIGMVEAAGKISAAAIDGMRASLAYFRGDIDAAHGSLDKFQAGLKQLPFGIGVAAEAGQALRNMFTGEVDDLARINAELTQIEQRMTSLGAAHAAVQQAAASSAATGQASRDTVSLLETPTEERDIKQVEIDTKNKIAAIEQARRTAVAQYRSQGLSDAAIGKLTSNFNLDVDRVMDERFSRIAELQRLAAEKLAATDRQSEKDRMAIFQESQQEQLRQRGDALGAQIAQLRQSYSEQARVIQDGVAEQVQNPFMTPETKARLIEEGNQKVLALDEQMKLKIAGLERTAYADRARIVADGEAALADLQSEARERRLADEGKSLDATIERIKRSYETQAKAIAKGLGDQLKTLPQGGDEEKKLRANAAERIKLLAEMRKQEERDAALQDKQRSPRTVLGNFQLSEGRAIGGVIPPALARAMGGGKAGAVGPSAAGGSFGPQADPLVAAQQRAASEAARTAGNTSVANDLLKQLIEAVRGTQLEPMNP